MDQGWTIEVIGKLASLQRQEFVRKIVNFSQHTYSLPESLRPARISYTD
jgi:hypothetical protein